MIPAGALAYLQSPQLLPLWTTIHRRLIRNGRTATGRLTISGLDPEQRSALGELLDRVVGTQMTIDLATLDRRLRNSAAGVGLLAVVEQIVGPVPDRRADAAASAARRSLLRDHADAALVAAGLGDCAWAPPWLDWLWRQGLPARLSSEDVRRLVDQASSALGLTVGVHARTWSRGELAQTVTGTAHGLDDDTPLARVVLRGLALALTAPFPANAEARRALWDAAGVTGDTVATTVLTYGLRPAADPWLCHRADRHAETHLTLREIRRLTPLHVAPQTIYVCENPRVLEAVADAAWDRAVVCTMGNPTTVTLALLDALTRSPDVVLAYHGDFDWPGIAIATRIFARYPARPWRFTAHDYRSAVARAHDHGTPRQPLTGRPIPAPWDPDLAAAMTDAGVAIHEEAVLETLLEP
ncbi:TIGR02679 family protein [Pseudosporangium ferrugineum]|uniref:Uncharacterized protein (TIGR02679 family) n=1 Tax=Pseudosporangium ferrugineum TaxID=439699 RepID=A0A2T0RJF4_9ACTN|nr:TIGR02679 family protein [Pseudosporangium ferrugineum]PRY21309.1 uncharacterized protein (TIGR02679 family) [Pseudosporangium ferrugineum]